MNKQQLIYPIIFIFSAIIIIWYFFYRTPNLDTSFDKNNLKLETLKQSADNEKYQLSEEEIEKRQNELDPLSYYVLAENGTEKPYENEYWDNKEEGLYVDKVTGEPLFSSTHKYDSKTGWPSFWRALDNESLTYLEDNYLAIPRIEVRSDGGHLGHIFNDGPIDKGGTRFCINSASLQFIPKNEINDRGYGDYLFLFE